MPDLEAQVPLIINYIRSYYFRNQYVSHDLSVPMRYQIRQSWIALSTLPPFFHFI